MPTEKMTTKQLLKMAQNMGVYQFKYDSDLKKDLLAKLMTSEKKQIENIDSLVPLKIIA